jgi:hypothetical protein
MRHASVEVASAKTKRLPRQKPHPPMGMLARSRIPYLRGASLATKQSQIETEFASAKTASRIIFPRFSSHLCALEKRRSPIAKHPTCSEHQNEVCGEDPWVTNFLSIPFNFLFHHIQGDRLGPFQWHLKGTCPHQVGSDAQHPPHTEQHRVKIKFMHPAVILQ